MRKHPLDRPIWSALTSRHAPFSEGGSLARRYVPSIWPFIAARDDSPESQQALADLVREDESLLLVQADNIVQPPGMAVSIVQPPGMVSLSSGALVQMIAERPSIVEHDSLIEQLHEADAPAMQALAELTKPGPFSPHALNLGEFWGVKENGALVAMAGERMKQDGFTEISGVCTHPDARGRGLARLLSMFMGGRILRRGETPFLHVLTTNTAAISLYQSIGFALRSAMNFAVIWRP
jgi:predicted GNAT family acetyltransferase